MITTEPGKIDGRKVGVIVAPDGDLAGTAKLRDALQKAGAELHVIAAAGGTLTKRSRVETVERTFLTTRSIEFDALVVADGAGSIRDIKVDVLLQEAYRHCKAIAAWGDGAELLSAAGLDPEAPGMVVSDTATAAHRKELIAAMRLHRAWDRAQIIMASQSS